MTDVKIPLIELYHPDELDEMIAPFLEDIEVVKKIEIEELHLYGLSRIPPFLDYNLIIKKIFLHWVEFDISQLIDLYLLYSSAEGDVVKCIQEENYYPEVKVDLSIDEDDLKMILDLKIHIGMLIVEDYYSHLDKIIKYLEQTPYIHGLQLGNYSVLEKERAPEYYRRVLSNPAIAVLRMKPPPGNYGWLYDFLTTRPEKLEIDFNGEELSIRDIEPLLERNRKTRSLVDRC